VTILLFIPIVNIIVLLFVSFGVAKNFGKSGLFAFFGLWLFSVIGYLMLAFGSAKYVGAKP
jgi:di/tricarboxylate transporter